MGRRLIEGLFSFALAVGAWLVLVPGAAVEEVTHQVPVEIENLPEEYALETINPTVVRVQVAGPRRAMLLARNEDFRLIVDAGLVALGRRTFAVTPELVRHETDLVIVGVQPEKVKLSVRKAKKGSRDENRLAR